MTVPLEDNMKKIFARTLAFFLATVLLLGTLTGCGGVFDPLGYLKDSIERTVSDSLAGQILGVLLEAVQGGSIALNFGGTELVEGLPDEAYAKIWFDAQNERVAADASLTLAGEKFEAQAFLTDLEAAVVSPTFFGSNTLGVDFATLENDLKTSIFSNNSGTVFSVPTISAASAARVSAIRNGAFDLLDATEDTLDTADEILAFFLEALSIYAVHTRYKEDGSVYISLDINNDSLARALRATHERIADDGALTKYLMRIPATVDSIYSAFTGVSGTAFSDKLRYFLNSEADIDELCLAIDEAEPFLFSLQARVRSFGMKVESLRATLMQDKVKLFDVSMSLAEQGEENKLSLSFGDVCHELTYCVTDDSYRDYVADLTYQMSAQATTVISATGTLQADKRAGTYILNLKQGERTCALSGKYLFEDEETMLSVEHAEINGQTMKLSLSLHLKADEKTPEVPAYLNVVQMDVTRFTPISVRATAASVKFLALWGATGFAPRGALDDLLKMMGFAT